MKIFYFCQTGVHTALLAANIHLGLLSENTIPTTRMLKDLKHFDSKLKQQIGEILFIGRDSAENEVYAFGVFNEKELGPRTIESLLKLYDVSSAEYKFVNMLDSAHPMVSVGLTLEFILGKNLISERLIIMGLRKSYKKIVQNVSIQNIG